MRFSIFSAALLLAFPAMAFNKNVCSGPQINCEGEVWIETVFTPEPIRRTAMVIISQDSLLSETATGSADISIGGNPISYMGPLYLKGEQEHVVVDPHTNERAQFVLKLSDDRKQLELSMTMLSPDNQTGMVVHASTLICL